MQKSLQNPSQPPLHAKGLTIKTLQDIINGIVLLHFGYTQKGWSAVYRREKMASSTKPFPEQGQRRLPTKLLDGVQDSSS